VPDIKRTVGIAPVAVVCHPRQGGADLLSGGHDADTLTSGPGSDSLFGSDHGDQDTYADVLFTRDGPGTIGNQKP
jgi:Ca2+-binding RTX toxin-like protein